MGCDGTITLSFEKVIGKLLSAINRRPMGDAE